MNADELLDGYGLSKAEVLREVESVYGVPKLVVITGSIAVGFGNENSDLDILVVVDGVDRVSQLPIMSYSAPKRFDTEYYTANDIAAYANFMEWVWPNRLEMPPNEWRAYYRAIRTCTRFAVGTVIDGQPEWCEWIAKFRTAWFHNVVARWWETEALRFYVGASWLSDCNPRLAAVRFGDSIMCALSGTAASEGELFLGKKWLPQKLERVGSVRGIEIFSEFAQLPCNMKQTIAYISRARSVLTELVPYERLAPAYRGQLWVADGLETYEMTKHTLVTRWGLRGTLVARGDAEDRKLTGGSNLLWTGALGEKPSGLARHLFINDMAWLSVAAAK